MQNVNHNSHPSASLRSGSKKICRGQDLANALARTELSDAEAKAWHRDLQTARKILKAPAARNWK